MGFIYDSIVNLSEELLDEDKMVKYNGELAPKFGWCVIYVGGPGSGKGTATKFLSRLEGDYFNVDNLKEIERFWNVNPTEKNDKGEWEEKGYSYADTFFTLPDDRYITTSDGKQIPNLGNKEFVSDMHDAIKPLGKKWKKSILDNPENKGEGRDRLPNLIFDITGDEVGKITEIIDAVKPVGYKVAIIWVLNTIERASSNNLSRDRQVDINNVFIPKHEDVILTMENIFANGVIDSVDEFWVIDAGVEIPNLFNSEDPNAKKQAELEYHNTQNVYHIPTNKDGLAVFDNIVDRISDNKYQLALMRARNN